LRPLNASSTPITPESTNALVALDAVRSPEAIRAVARFADITGWRGPSEVLTLQWRQVDFGSGQVRLDPGTTKNGEGRVFRMTAALRELVEAQRAERNRLRADRGSLCPFVFHRNGVPITAFTKASKTACLKAGCPGRIPHDLRRTAVRNLVRAGVPERVATQMTGTRRAPFSSGTTSSAKPTSRTRSDASTSDRGIARAVGTTDARPTVRFTEEMLEAPPGFEPGMEVLQIKQGNLCCWFVLLSGICQTVVFPGVWAVLDPSWTQIWVEFFLRSSAQKSRPSTAWTATPKGDESL
jgi:hypothetical protein